MMESPPVVEHTVAEEALVCHKLFCDGYDVLNQVGCSAAAAQLRDQFGRFNVWATNIGVFAKVLHATMDYRIRDLPDARDLAIDNLHVIVNRLRQLIQAVRLALEEPSNSNATFDNHTTQDTEKLKHLERDITEIIEVISEYIGWLNKLSNHIRQSSKTRQNLKAALAPLDDAEKTALENMFSGWVRREFPGITNELRQRLAQSMLLRRRQILYRRSRLEKLRLNRSVNNPQMRFPLPSEHTIDQSTIATSQNSDPEIAKTPQFTQDTASNYTATTIDPEAYLRMWRPPSKVSKVRTLTLGKHGKLMVPRPPKAIGQEFQCPYCCLVLPIEEVNNLDNWVEHVKKDSEPYVCMFEDCENFEAIFTSYGEWISHMRSQHMIRWRCVAKTHAPIVFDKPAKYELHMKSEHPQKFGRNQLRILTENGGRAIGPTFTSCPFCGEQSGDLDDHVGHHLHYVALQSLPFPDNFDTGSASNDGSSPSASFSSDQSSTRKGYDTHMPVPDFLDSPALLLSRPLDKSIPEFHIDVPTDSQIQSVRYLTWAFLPTVIKDHVPLKPYEQSDDPVFQNRVHHFVSRNASASPYGVAELNDNSDAANIRQDRSETYYHLTFARNKHFVGREEILHELINVMFSQGETRKVAITGLCGIGKTQVALNLAYWAKDNNPNYSIFWVAALSRATFEQSYIDIANQLPIEERIKDEDPKEFVRRYLCSKAAGSWLLVVDNADDVDMFFGSSEFGTVNQYLPESDLGLILFTTRSRKIAVSIAAGCVIELPELDSSDARHLLKTSLLPANTHNERELTDLSKELVYLPLAIKQAAAYINSTGESITKYLNILRGTNQEPFNLICREFHDPTRYTGPPNSMGSICLESFNQICRSHTAAKLLCFISCIEPKMIPQSMLLPLESKEQITHTLNTLCDYAFLSKREGGDIFDVHNLVHLALQVWVKRQHYKADKMAIRHLAAIFPNDDHANRNLWREYLAHAVKVLKQHEVFDTIDESELCYWVGRCLRMDGHITEALSYLGIVCQWRNSHLTEHHPSRLASQHELARAYLANGQLKEAVKLLEHVVAIRRAILTINHPHRLASQHELAGVYLANSQVKEAITLLEQIVATDAALPEDDPGRLASQHELAGAYLANEQVTDAIKLLQHVVAIREALLDQDHADRLASQHELAGAYLANGQVSEAINLLEHVVTIESALHQNHPSRLVSQHELARAYLANYQVSKAVELLERVVAIEKAVLTEGHPYRLASQQMLDHVQKFNQVQKFDQTGPSLKRRRI